MRLAVHGSSPSWTSTTTDSLLWTSERLRRNHSLALTVQSWQERWDEPHGAGQARSRDPRRSRQADGAVAAPGDITKSLVSTTHS
jgi:hypothetical protein